MPEQPSKPLSADDWSAVAEWIKNEKDRRAGTERRRTLEMYWKEIDRQVDMVPLARKTVSGDDSDWLPDTELPLQFNTLEVNCADARRLKFPRGSEWYQVSANLTDEYTARFSERRQKYPIIGGEQPIPMQLSQDTANTLVKATLDYYHRQYDFRSAIDLFDVECIKYGTGILRTREVTLPKFSNDFRGTKAQQVRGPGVFPVPIKTVYLDDTVSAVMHEGIVTAPGHIRCFWKRLTDLQRAIVTGGAERGWRQAAVKKLIPDKTRDDKNEEVEFIEFEGDLIVPRARGKAIFLPGVIVSVATGANAPEVVRYLERDYPFSSYDVGYYMRDKLDGPYGTSPLIKGQPLQEAATAILNALMTGAALNALPPCFYDGSDHNLVAAGGPRLYPGAKNKVYSPEAVNFLERIDLSAMTNAYLSLVKQYEDTTAVNDPRRGGPVRSHTTAAAIDIEQSRGLSRTDDFVQGQLYGPITSILYKEFEIIKRVQQSPTDITVDSGGIEGWVKIASADLADQVSFLVHGSAGLLNERQRFENFMTAVNTSVQLLAAAAQMGKPVNADFDRIIQEVFRNANINNGGSLFGPAAGASDVSGGAAGQPQLPPGAPGIPTNNLAAIQAAVGV